MTSIRRLERISQRHSDPMAFFHFGIHRPRPARHLGGNAALRRVPQFRTTLVPKGDAVQANVLRLGLPKAARGERTAPKQRRAASADAGMSLSPGGAAAWPTAGAQASAPPASGLVPMWACPAIVAATAGRRRMRSTFVLAPQTFTQPWRGNTRPRHCHAYACPAKKPFAPAVPPAHELLCPGVAMHTMAPSPTGGSMLHEATKERGRVP